MADPYNGTTGTTDSGGENGGGTADNIPAQTIHNFDELAKVIPSFSQMTLAQLFASPIFTGPDAYMIDPKFFQELQNVGLQLEQGYGVPISQIPADVFSNVSNLKKAVAGTGGGGGGGGGSAQPYGYNAPDPLGAANALLNQYLAQIEGTQGQFNAEMAIKEFEKNWAELSATQTRAEGQERTQREISEANRRLGVAEEAGRRAQTVGRDYLPFMIPGAQSLNLPLIGNMPLNQVNLGQVFSQGGVGNLAQLPSINPNPSVNYGVGPMPSLPQVPTFPGMPNIQDYINQAASGSPPLGWA